MKPARLRPRAQEDLIEIARGCLQAGGRALGERAFDAALAALAPIEAEAHLDVVRLLCDRQDVFALLGKGP